MRFYSNEHLSRPRRLIGLMSGTSVDGIDAAAVVIHGAGDAIRTELAGFVTIPMDPALTGAVHDAFNPRRSGADALTLLHAALGLAFAEAAVEARAAAGWKRTEVDAIGSHGQTIWHQPGPVELAGAFVTGTLQLGDPATIAERLGAPVVSDFRARDMAAGGQGAPLVPMVDWLLYRDASTSRALQNIGGVGNVTWLPAGGGIDDVIAFDTGPGNMVLDAAARLLTSGALKYDEDGRMAARGTVHEDRLQFLLQHKYFACAPPKSTGRELFGADYSGDLVRNFRALGMSEEDVMATFTALTAESIARSYREFLPAMPDEVIVGGGGARNPALMAMLRDRLPGVRLRTHEEIGSNGDAKEAVAFAVLADRTLQGLPGNVPHATGASRSVPLGSVTPA
ncbi:MAG TPA: anhydro-N-acetylmuramic acid kinase [Armatimonadota bacterium]|jgi:anhydro-N-acetylmuramic acid kinase